MTESRSAFRTAIAALSLFALGAVAGITTDRLMHRPVDREHVVIGGDTIRVRDIHTDPVGALDRAVGLRPGQREKVTAILAKRQQSIDVAWKETQGRLRATVDSMVNEVAAVLDPDQQEKFRALANALHSEPHVIQLRRR
jgi:hypothetical protein